MKPIPTGDLGFAPHDTPFQSVSELTILGIEHEMKNLLSRLRGSTMLLDQMIRQSQIDPLLDIWQVHRRAVDRLDELIASVFSVDRESLTQPVLSAIGQLVVDVCTRCMESFAQYSVDIEWCIQQDCPPIPLHPLEMGCAISALVGNAMESCRDVGGGHAHVTVTTETERFIRIEITDNGPGIAPAIQQKIFEPSFSTKGSSGVGLTLARRIVENHGGTIHWASRDGLTCFIVRLPME